MRTRKKMRYAPRMRHGGCRLKITHELPPELKEALQIIAETDDKTVSHLLELAITDYFGLKRLVQYKRK